MKKLVLISIAFLILLLSFFCYADERIDGNLWVNDPNNNFTADIIIFRRNSPNSSFKLSLNDTYTINPIVWDIYANKWVDGWDNTAIAYWTLNADANSMGNIMNPLIINANSTNPLLPPRAIVAGTIGDNALTGSFLAVGDNAIPATFTGIGTNAHVLIDCDLWVTGQIINPPSIQNENKVQQLEERIVILEKELTQKETERDKNFTTAILDKFRSALNSLTK